MTDNSAVKREPLFHIVKRTELDKWKAVLIRVGAIFFALFVCGIMSEIFKKGTFFQFYASLFSGVFGSGRRIWLVLQNMAMLLCISLAVTPAFKMKFWNIGAEGQVLVAALASACCVWYIGGKVDNTLLILIMAAASIAAGAIWAVIPAIFKAKWNTNETLFTLMMNYIAVQLVLYVIKIWVPSGSMVVGIMQYGHFPVIAGQKYFLNIILVALLTVVIFIYMKYSKHGYELSVVGESENTAKYIGINVKKVIIRTMLLSGVLCGIAGLLLVGGTNYTITSTLVDGRGFTAILVSWLAKFNPLYMVGTAFLVTFFDQGASQAATTFGLGGEFADMITGIFFIVFIASEFFIQYKIKFRSFKKEEIA